LPVYSNFFTVIEDKIYQLHVGVGSTYIPDSSWPNYQPALFLISSLHTFPICKRFVINT